MSDTDAYQKLFEGFISAMALDEDDTLWPPAAQQAWQQLYESNFSKRESVA